MKKKPKDHGVKPLKETDEAKEYWNEKKMNRDLKCKQVKKLVTFNTKGISKKNTRDRPRIKLRPMMN